jgi:hypothetical protein
MVSNNMNKHYKLQDRRRTIADATGFDNGGPFYTRDEVHDYFTVEAQRDMFGHEAIDDPETLEEMARDVIEHGWNCNFEVLDVKHLKLIRVGNSYALGYIPPHAAEELLKHDSRFTVIIKPSDTTASNDDD